MTFPVDANDQRLLDAVHPANWVNPAPAERYHLVVLGAGTAGLVTAAIAASLGAKVALVERHLMGGDCLNVGCVPSKALIAAARAWQSGRDAEAQLHGPAVSGTGDFAAVMTRMRALRADIAPIDGAARFAGLGVDVFLGEGAFAAPDALSVGGATLRFKRAVIATGARAVLPPVPGLAEAMPLTNETVFDLMELPAELIVLGAGPIGCELAQSFARFGSRITVVDQSPRILPRDDADAAAVVHAAMVRDGVRFELGVQVQGVQRDGARVILTITRDGATHHVSGTHLLVAAGRAANVEGIGLEQAGVAFTKKCVTVNDHFRTSNSRIFAVGDVIGQHQFTHAADFHARAVVRNALFLGRAKASALVIPWATYTSPEVAHVGPTADELAARGTAIETITVPFHDNDRAVLAGQTDGFLKLHVAAGSDRIVAATLVAEHAGDLIGEATLAITHGIGLGKIAATIHPYPTLGEAYRKAGDLWNRRKLTETARRFFGWWFRVFR
jgi:pyruvate/2-oxoglutarate dehydrogenase complex dihydrolipoamide dehydrogenase (E3) component